MKKLPIIVLGIEFTEERFPNLYKMAQRNPERLADWLKSLAKASGDDKDIQSNAIFLEHDLEHERRVNMGGY